MINRRGWVVLACLAIAAGAVVLSSRGHGAEGHEHHSAAGRFYQSWMMPDAPHISCCHDQDCAPAASKFDPATGQWFARFKDDDEWVRIPPEKIERDRDTPDGRSHMCGRTLGLSGERFTVFCFVRGGGV